MPVLKVLLCACSLALSASSFGADTVYKVVRPDGSITYSDQPPADAPAQRLEFRNLPSSPLPESVLKFRADIERSLKARLDEQRQPRSGELRLFTAQWCPYCRRAKAHLAQRGVSFTEYDIDTPDGMAAFVQAAGGAVPLLVTSTARVQGYTEQTYDRFVATLRPR